MEEVYKIINDIQHRVKNIRDFSSGNYREIACGVLVYIDKLIILLEETERKDNGSTD